MDVNQLKALGLTGQPLIDRCRTFAGKMHDEGRYTAEHTFMAAAQELEIYRRLWATMMTFKETQNGVVGLLHKQQEVLDKVLESLP